jgi:iron complex outermembrane recepter protein
MQVHSYFGAVTEEVFNITNHVAYNVESRVFPIVKLTYTRSFGSASPNSPRNESNEEKDRIRKD